MTDRSPSDSRAGSQAGGCLCGAVRFTISGPLRGIVLCHCSQCLRIHGHIAGHTRVTAEGVSFAEDRGLAWYRSSAAAERGFCSECGASLFFRPVGAKTLSISAGCLQQPTGLATIGQIYVDSASDYYEIDRTIPVLSLEDL